MLVGDILDTEDLAQAIDAGYVAEKLHPDYEDGTHLALYVYENSCVLDAMWTPTTKVCRGLIVDHDTWRVVALPFPKSFLVDVHKGGAPYVDPLPTTAPRVTTKVDGSLAIIYWWAEKWRVATKGSFQSDQARAAQQHLDTKETGGLYRGVTYLAEWLSPANRIVVDNGDTERLVLLGGRNLKDGRYERLDHLRTGWAQIGTVVKSWGVADDVEAHAARIKANHRPDDQEVKGTEFEGVVYQWEDGTMAKAKTSDYITRHALFTETTEKGIWRHISAGGDLEDIFQDGPDEIVDWVKRVAARLTNEKNALVNQVVDAYTRALAHVRRDPSGEYTRKQLAEALVDEPLKRVVFLLHDKDYTRLDGWAWRQVEPFGKVTYRAEEN